MGTSIVAALSRSFDRTRQLLFPFQLDKWLHLGFIAFLAQLASGGVPTAARFPDFGSATHGGSPGASPLEDFTHAWSRLREAVDGYFWLAALGVVLGALLFFFIGLGLLYVGCRARFMFVESVIHDRAAVREPWTRLREPGWSLFKARLLLTFGFGLIPLAALGVAAVVAWPDIIAGQFGSRAISALLIAGLGVLLWLPLAIVLALIDDFVVPLMYLEGVGVMEGWRRFRAHVLPGRALEVLLFYALKIALAMGASMVAFLASCLTCCVAALPYVSTVVLLPYHVLMQAFSLYALELFGLQVFPLAAPQSYWQPNDERFRE